MGGIDTIQALDQFLKSPLPSKQKTPAFGPPPPEGTPKQFGPPKPPLPEVKSVQDLDSFLKSPLQSYDLTPVEHWKNARNVRERIAADTPKPGMLSDERLGKAVGIAAKVDEPIERGIHTAQEWVSKKIDQVSDLIMQPQRKQQDWLALNGYPTLAKISAYSEAVNPVNWNRELYKQAAGMVVDPKMWPFLLEGGGTVRPVLKHAGTALFTVMQQYGALDALRNRDWASAAMQEAFALLGMKDLSLEVKTKIGEAALEKHLDGISQEKFKKPWSQLTKPEQAKIAYDLANTPGPPVAPEKAAALAAKGKVPPSVAPEAAGMAMDLARGTAAAREAVPSRELPPPPEPTPVEPVVESEKVPYRPVTGGDELPDNESMYMTPDERSQRYYTIEEARKRLDEERRITSQEQETRAAAESDLQRIARERREQFEGEKAYRDAREGKRLVVTERRGLQFDEAGAEANRQEYSRLSDEMNRIANEHMYFDSEDMLTSLDTEKGRGKELEEWKKNVTALESRRRELMRLSNPEALAPTRTEAFEASAEDIALAKREASMREAAAKIEAEAKKQTDADEFEKMQAEADEAKKRAEDIRTERDKKESERAAATAEREEYPLGPVMDMVKGVGGFIILPDTRKIAFHYAVVPAEQVISSHDPFNNFEPNADAIQVSQGRDYKNNRESQAATIARGKNPEMDLLVNTAPTAETGPPIVRSDGQALGGRNRVNIWKLLYKNGFDDMAYQAMTAKARELGVTPEQVANYYTSGRQPMVVRVLDDPYTSTKDLAQLGRDLDRTQTMGFSQAEEAVMAGRSISDQTLDWISGQLDAMGEDASLRDLMRYRGGEVVERMLESNMISPTQRAEYITANGEMTEKGKNLFESAVLGKVIDDAELLSTTPKEVLRKLERSVAALARVKAAGGLWDFIPELQDSLRLWKRVDSVRESLNQIGTADESLVDKYLNPGKYKMGTELMKFDGNTVRETPHPTVEALAKLLEKPGKEIKLAIGDYADDAEGKQITMGPPPSAVESFNRHVGNLVKVDVPDDAWGVLRPKGAVSEAIKEEEAPDVPPAAKPQPEPTGIAVPPPLEGGRVTVSDLVTFLESRPGVGEMAKPLTDAMGIVVKNATGMDLDEFVGKNIKSLRTDTAPDSALTQSAADAAVWARRAGRKLTVTPYGEQLDIFGGSEPQFILRSKTGDERLLLKSELLKIREVVPRLQELVDRDGNIQQGGLFGAEEENLFGPGEEEDEGPQGMLFQGEKEGIEKLRQIMTPPPPRDLVAEGRMTPNLAEWEPPPELGAFADRPDVGAKARATIDKETGPLKRGEERRKVDRTNQKEADRLFSLARKELGEDASSDDIQKRAEAIGLREVFEKSKSVGQKEADWFAQAKKELYPGQRELSNEEIGKVSARAMKMRQEAGPLRQGKRGAVEFEEDGKAILHMFEKSDPSTFLHEFFHIMRRWLKPEDQKVLEGWLKIKDGMWSRADEEKAAQSWEYYHRETKPQTLPEKVAAVFKKIQTIMRQVYEQLKDSPLVKPSKEVAALFDRWYGKEMEPPPGEVSGATRTTKDRSTGAAPAKGMSDSVLVDTQRLTDLTQSASFKKKGLSGLDIPSQRMVMSDVIAALHDLKIRNTVVKLIPVDVMDNLVGIKGPAKVSFHDKYVLLDSETPDLKSAVALRSDTASALAAAVAKRITEVSASVLKASAAQASRESLPTVGAEKGHVHSGATVSEVKTRSKPKGEKIPPAAELEAPPLTAEERKDVTLKAQGGILPLDTGAVRTKVFSDFQKAQEWAQSNKDKIKGLQIFALKDGRAVADFTAKKENVLFQTEHEREREKADTNGKIAALSARLQHMMSDAERSLLNRQIRDLKAKQAGPVASMEPPPGQVTTLWTPEGEVEVKREAAKETRPARTVPDEAIRLSEPPRPRETAERPRAGGISEPKPASGRGVRTTGERAGERADLGQPRTTLRDVRPVSLAPVPARGEAAYSGTDWQGRVERFKLPENAPAPTRTISDELGRMLMPGQREVVESIVSGLDQHDGYILATTTGSGKCLAPGTPVLMFDGSIKKVEDVVVGDLLMGPDSKPRVVLSLASGVDNMYRVTPTKGDPYEVNEPHILSVKMTGGTFNGKKWSRKIVNLPVAEYLQKSRTWKHCAKGYRVGVEFADQPVPLPAYFLGIWLGDGHSHIPAITTVDPEIIAYVDSMADWFGLDIRVDQSGGRCPSYVLTSRKRGGKTNIVYQRLKDLGVFRNKHIPLEYKANSRHNRLQLLAGLMDTDGSLSGGFDFISKWKTLAEDVAFLARSLGFAAYVSPCKKTCTNNGKVGDYFRVSISGDVSQIPVRIRHKQAAPRRQKKDVLVTGIKVEPIGRGKYFGFEITGDGLFLLGDFTVTHNTYMGSAVIADMLNRNPEAKVLVLTPSQSLIHGRDGWIQVAGNFGIEVEPVPVGEMPEQPGVFIKTWAGGIANRDIENVPWDLVIMDEVQEARKWWSSQRGDMSKTMGENAKKILYTSATPFHTALEIGHMSKLGLWGGKGFERWAAENGLGVYRDKAGNLAGGNSPLRLEKLRQQLIERGQMINLDRNMTGYSAHFGKVPMDGVTQQGLANIDKALQLAENYFERSGKKGMIQATKAQRTTLAKRWLEYQRLPQAIELGKKLENEGWKVIFFSENKKEFTELFDFLKPADEAMGGRISQLMPKFKNTTDVLRDAFGEDVAVFAGKHSSAREAEKDAFNDDSKKHLYATYGAGGVGVSLHDKGGDKPRAVIYMGPPWSGISFDQALGRPWRFGTKSNVRAYFLFSDSQAEMDLVTNKVAPRMESLRAMVSGVNFNDPVVKHLRSVPENQVGALDYDHGNAHETDFDQFTKRADSSGVSSYSELPIVSAEEAKNKGMKLPGSDGAQDPSVIRLWQDSVDDDVLPQEFEAPELTLGRQVNVELAERFIDTGAAPGNSAGRTLKPAERRQIADAIMAKAEAAAAGDPASATQQVYTEWENGMKQIDAILSGNNEPPSIEPPPGEGIPNVPGGAEPPKPEKIGFWKAKDLYYLTNGRDVIRSVTKKAGTPAIGENIARSIAQYHVEAGNISGPWTTKYWDILKDNKISPEEHKVLALTLANREKRSASIDQQLAELRSKAPMNERIERAVKQTQDLFKEVFNRMQKDNIYLQVWDATSGKPRQIYYSEFSSGSGYWPRKYDWETDHRVRDPETGVETVFNLRNLTKGEMGASKREQIVRGMMDRYGLRRSEVEDFLQSKKRDVPLVGHIERAREVDMPFFRTDPDVVISYLEGAGELLSRKKYFEQDGSKVKGLIAQIPDQKARNITGDIVETLLKRNPMEDESRTWLRFAADWSVMKMTFSAIKVLGHPVHGALLTNVRSFAKGLFDGTVGYADAQRRAQLAGSIAEQTKVEMLSEYGVNKKGIASAMLKWNGWQGAYKWGRVVADATGRVYMTDSALGKLLKDPKNEVVRRHLKEFLQLDDAKIDGAIARRRWTEEDLAWGGKAFADKVMFTFDPTELPPTWRARAGANHPYSDDLITTIRTMTLLKGYQFKTHALLKDALWDEAMKGNFRPLIPFLMLYPAAGFLLHSLTSLATANGKYFKTLMQDKSWTPGRTLWRMVDEIAHMIGDTALTAWLDAAVHGKETIAGTIGEEYFSGAVISDVGRTIDLPIELQHAKSKRAKEAAVKRYVEGINPLARTLFNTFEPPPGARSEGPKVLPHMP